MTLRGNWNYPASIKFGAGRIAELAEHCKALGMTRPLLVTDPGMAKLPMVGDAIASNAKAGLPTGLFSDVAANPVEANVTAGVAAFKAGGHDGVIALGGGAALDAGKAIAFMTLQTRPIADFEDREDWWTRAVTAGLPPVIAVPTTAGTGSEVGRSSVIIDATQTKKIIFHPRFLPALVIADPELTLGLPPKVTAAVGMDALSHCLEAWCATNFHPMADGIALEGMALVKRWLPVAVADGANIEARAHMLVAATMGATAFQKNLGAMHAMSHPCSARHHTHHGLTNAVVMPYVLMHNRAVLGEKLTALARYLDLPHPSFEAVLRWVLDLRREIGIPHTLGEIGIKMEHVPVLAAEALRDPSSGGNPVAMTAADYDALFRRAIAGKV